MVSALLASPLPFAVLGGIFVGMAVSRATRRTDRSRDPARARTGKWVGFCVYLSLAVVLGILAVFLPGARKIADIRVAYVAAAAAILSFAGTRFRLALGIPIVVILVLAVTTGALFLRSIRAFTGETTIATVRVISAGQDSMRLQLLPRDGEPAMVTMQGEYFAPIVKVVIFNDLWVFLGAHTWYRFEGLTSFRMVKEGDGYRLRQGTTDYYLPRAAGISERLWSLFEANERSIPGVKTVQIEMDLKRAEPTEPAAQELHSYEIRVQNDGGVEVVPVNG